MKVKKSYRYISTAVLTIILISVSGISCQIEPSPGEEAPVSMETVQTGEESSMQKEVEPEEIEEEASSVNLWVDGAVPEEISLMVNNRLGEAFDEIVMVDNEKDSDFRAEINGDPGSQIAIWAMAPVVSFFRDYDSLSYDDFKRFWAGDNDALSYISADGSPAQLIVTGEVFKALQTIMGESINENIEIVSEDELLLNIEDDNSFSIVPFDSIEKKYKVLDLDDMSVFDKELDINGYPFSVTVSLECDDPELEVIAGDYFKDIMMNRDVGKMTSVIMTGVTAPARGKTIGRRMDEYGVIYPAEKIADILRDADITHISNEI
jgi:hypothetical protein